jgi:Leucine-rich repeat (LRR) protein
MLKYSIVIALLFMVADFSFAQKIPKDTTVELSNTRIYTEISDIAVQPDSVQYIDFSKMKLTAIPVEVFACRNLVYLNLNNNKIDSIPPRIGELKQLRVLQMAHNKLTHLPAEIGRCDSLRSLILNQNRINDIVPEIGQLSHLAVLDLWGNNVTVLPKEIGRLSESLKYLDMRVIYMSEKNQTDIEDMLPETTIYFSASCNCSQ